MDEITRIKNYENYKEALRAELHTQAASFVRTGYLLRLAKETDILAGSGYSDVNEFAKAEFGIDETIVSRYININRRFSQNGYSEQLQEQYKGFGWAKLSVMLMLPDEINEELTDDYSKSEIQEIKEEIEAEQKITDLEVMMEGQDEAQAQMESNFQRAIHQLLHDQKELFVKIWSIPEDLSENERKRYLYEVMAPQGVATYSVRVQGVGKFMIFIKGADQDLSFNNIRTKEKEECGWAELQVVIDMLIGERKCSTAEECWEKLYGEKFREEIAPVQPQPEKKPEKRKQSKVTKAKTKKPAPEAAVEEKKPEPAEEQVEGQTSIEKDFPEYCPENSGEITGEIAPVQPQGEEPVPAAGVEEMPENPMETRCEGLREYVWKNKNIWNKAFAKEKCISSYFRKELDKAETDEELKTWLKEIHHLAIGIAADMEKLMLRKGEE